MDLEKGIFTKHVLGHSYKFHDCADLLAKGETILKGLDEIWNNLGGRPKLAHAENTRGFLLTPQECYNKHIFTLK